MKDARKQSKHQSKPSIAELLEQGRARNVNSSPTKLDRESIPKEDVVQTNLTQKEIDDMMNASSSDDELVKPTYKITEGAKGKSNRPAWEENQGEVNVHPTVDKSATFHVPVMADAN